MNIARKFLRLLLIPALTALALPSMASTIGRQAGQVLTISVRSSDGLNVITLSGSATSRTECGINRTYWIIKDENSNTGKKQLAMLMTAKLSGQAVFITGAGTCIRWNDGEDIDDVSF